MLPVTRYLGLRQVRVASKAQKKGTPFAAQTAADSAARRAIDQGMRQCEVQVRWPLAQVEKQAIFSGTTKVPALKITLIRDVTPNSSNGAAPLSDAEPLKNRFCLGEHRPRSKEQLQIKTATEQRERVGEWHFKLIA